MKEHPILFSAPMVRALLDGRKTQTRRVVKPQPLWVAEPSVPFKTPDADPKGIIYCPYGQPGDQLWVRESWRIGAWDENDGTLCIDFKCDEEGRYKWEPGQSPCRWRPSIHMPRWASRILLEITGTRVERLQDISESDAKAEGCQVPSIIHPDEPRNSYIYAEQFRMLWESINGDGSWDANPWVWVIEFKVFDK